MCLKKNIAFFGLIFFLQSCNTIDVYEKTVALPRHEWQSADRLSLTFDIKDSLAYYNLYFVLRHTESYHYNNIWIDLTSVFPNDTARTQRLNIQLANTNGWLGTAMDDIIEQRLLINKQPLRLRAGTYQFSLQQIMREDPLQNILNAGLRVEKIVQ
jgi:gliding motility-associated lipoprotein GldH